MYKLFDYFYFFFGKFRYDSGFLNQLPFWYKI